MSSHHLACHRLIYYHLIFAVIAASFLPVLLHAQAPAPLNAKPGAASADAPSPTTTSGSASIETEMLSYEAMRAIAHEISARGAKTMPQDCNHKVLLQDVNTIAQLTAAGAFDLTTSRLLSTYRHTAAGFVSGGTAINTLSEATGILTQIRSTALYTSQTFQPSAASMGNLLAAELGSLTPSFALYSTTYPGDLIAAGKDINQRLLDLDDAQAKITDVTKRKDLDAEYTALQTRLASTSADGTLMTTVLKGQALRVALEGGYCVLNYSVDGAGGATRVSHPFLWEIFFPSPEPSYSGGAIVSFVYSTSEGKFLSGDSLRYLFGFSKLHGCRLRTASNLEGAENPCLKQKKETR